MTNEISLRREFKPDTQKQLRALTILLEATPLSNASRKHADAGEGKPAFDPAQRQAEERNPDLRLRK